MSTWICNSGMWTNRWEVQQVCLTTCRNILSFVLYPLYKCTIRLPFICTFTIHRPPSICILFLHLNNPICNQANIGHICETRNVRTMGCIIGGKGREVVGRVMGMDPSSRNKGCWREVWGGECYVDSVATVCTTSRGLVLFFKNKC